MKDLIKPVVSNYKTLAKAGLDTHLANFIKTCQPVFPQYGYCAFRGSIIALNRTKASLKILFGFSLDGLQIINLEGIEILQMKFQDIELNFDTNLITIEGEGQEIRVSCDNARLVKDCFEWYQRGKLLDVMM